MSLSESDRLDRDSKTPPTAALQSHPTAQHSGGPLLMPYQITIRFPQLFPADGRPIGNPHSETRTAQPALCQPYIPPAISRSIRCRRSSAIEGRFLCRWSFNTVQYDVAQHVVESFSLRVSYSSVCRPVEQDPPLTSGSSGLGYGGMAFAGRLSNSPAASAAPLSHTVRGHSDTVTKGTLR